MSAEDTKALYLNLMKQVLTYSLWTPPPEPLEILNYARPFPRKQIFQFLTAGARRLDMQIARVRPIDENAAQQGYWSIVADTMIGTIGLDNIQFCMEQVLLNEVPGDFIETGVWRGGSCIFMRAVLAAYQVKDRFVYVADSFRGLPKPDPVAFKEDANDQHWKQDFLSVSKESVENNFKRYALLDDKVIFLEGWFKDTLPHIPSKKFAVIRLDGDMYESTIQAMTSLYPKLSSGGYCIIDDYHLDGCKKAVDHYRMQNGITATIEFTKGNPVFWKKD